MFVRGRGRLTNRALPRNVGLDGFHQRREPPGMTRYLTQAEVDQLPDGTRVEVRWPGRDWSGVLMIRRRSGAGIVMVWAASVPNGYAVGPLNQVGAPGTGLTTVRLAGTSDGD